MEKRKLHTRTTPPDPKVMGRKKDFGAFMDNYRKGTTPLYKKPLYKNPRLFLALLLIILVAILVFESGEESPSEKQNPTGADTVKNEKQNP
jgi:hypothetical protein